MGIDYFYPTHRVTTMGVNKNPEKITLNRHDLLIVFFFN